MAPGLAIMLSGGLPSTTSALSGRRELGKMGKQGEKEKERNKREGKRKRRAGPLKERRASERRRGRGGQGAGDTSVFWVTLRRGSRASSDQNSPSLARPPVYVQEAPHGLLFWSSPVMRGAEAGVAVVGNIVA